MSIILKIKKAATIKQPLQLNTISKFGMYLFKS
ncbi:MAG: hypothetical protein A8274_1351 [Halanaerobium sp. 4-GBenrich]|jgi:hypothetical protein|nr:MAG: hypothetical protein A8274_1351 [Halanaerobium sp. 4-GBenrich]